MEISIFTQTLYINNKNGANYTMNLNVACKTTGLATVPFLSCTVADGLTRNGIDTITTVSCGRRAKLANSGYYNKSIMHG
jgi:hypothetical protein